MPKFRTKYLGISLIILSTLYFSSCKKDDNTKQDGSDDRDKFVRSWACSESSQQQGNSNYTIIISNDVTTSNQILVKNFYNLGNTTSSVMIVDGNNVTIASQNVSGNVLHGSGHYNSSSSLTFNFTADDGITVDTVSLSAH